MQYVAGERTSLRGADVPVHSDTFLQTVEPVFIALTKWPSARS